MAKWRVYRVAEENPNVPKCSKIELKRTHPNPYPYTNFLYKLALSSVNNQNMSMTKLLSVALGLLLVACSSGPYSDIKNGQRVNVRTLSGGYSSGNVIKKTSEGLYIKNNSLTQFFPWSSVESVSVVKLNQ